MADLLWENRTRLDDSEELHLGDEERRLMQSHLEAVFEHHVMPPACIGSRRAGVPHKLHAYYHSYWNETGSWSLLRAVIRSIVAVTTDQGTEFGFCTAPPINIPTFFPHLWDMDEDAAAEPISLNHALQVPGALHVLDNIVKHLCGCLFACLIGS